MTPDELLDLLDLAGPEPPLLDGLRLTPAAASAPSPAGPTALVLDAWGLRLGRELHGDSPRLQHLGLDEYAAADFLAAAFLPDPRLAAACADPPRRAFLAALFETPAYRDLHTGTALSEPAAAVAAVAFAEGYAQHRDRTAQPDGGDGDDAVGGVAEMAAVVAASRAASAAATEVRELSAAAEVLGFGPGQPRSLDTKAVAALYRRLRADPALRRVCDAAGRLRHLTGAAATKLGDGPDTVTGVTTGGDVGRLLPTELVRLVVPEFELDALRRIAAREALSREFVAREPAGHGPVVVCVDESGSMEGHKVEAAKAVALAIAGRARRQRRWVGLVAYSGDSGERLLALPPARWDGAALAAWVGGFFGRGSDLDVPVRELPDYLRRLAAPPGVTDVLMITDAACRIPAAVAARFNAWRTAAKARVVTLVVGRPPGDLTLVSDECHRVDGLDAGEPAVARVLRS